MADVIPFDDRDGSIWFDGKLVPWREAKIHVLTHGLHYASCVFEGERMLFRAHLQTQGAHRAAVRERAHPRNENSVYGRRDQPGLHRSLQGATGSKTPMSARWSIAAAR